MVILSIYEDIPDMYAHSAGRGRNQSVLVALSHLLYHNRLRHIAFLIYHTTVSLSLVNVFTVYFRDRQSNGFLVNVCIIRRLSTQTVFKQNGSYFCVNCRFLHFVAIHGSTFLHPRRPLVLMTRTQSILRLSGGWKHLGWDCCIHRLGVWCHNARRCFIE